jgi:transcriptional regulator with XRE-family HTH domain
MTEYVGKNIKYYRKQRGLTQEQLAEAVGFSLSSMKSIENGNSLPSLENFTYICKALNIPADFILADADKKFKIAVVAQMMDWLIKLEDEHFDHVASTVELLYFFKSHMKDPPFIFQRVSKPSCKECDESLSLPI